MTKTARAMRAVASDAVFGHASNARRPSLRVHSRSGWRRGRPNTTMAKHGATHAKRKRKRRSARSARVRTPRSTTHGGHDAVTTAMHKIQRPCPRTGPRPMHKIQRPCPRTGRRRAGTSGKARGFNNTIGRKNRQDLQHVSNGQQDHRVVGVAGVA